MQNLNDLSVSELTAMYNKRVGADAQIKKFSTKADGVRRVGALLKVEETTTVAKKRNGPRRVELIIEALKLDGSYDVAALATIANCKESVVRNDLCDIRKQFGDKLVRDGKKYHIV